MLRSHTVKLVHRIYGNSDHIIYGNSDHIIQRPISCILCQARSLISPIPIFYSKTDRYLLCHTCSRISPIPITNSKTADITPLTNILKTIFRRVCYFVKLPCAAFVWQTAAQHSYHDLRAFNLPDILLNSFAQLLFDKTYLHIAKWLTVVSGVRFVLNIVPKTHLTRLARNVHHFTEHTTVLRDAHQFSRFNEMHIKLQIVEYIQKSLTQLR